VPGLAFLKFAKKASFNDTSSSSEVSQTDNKQCSELEQRKKRFVFRFNETPFSNDLLLPSPSQAFSNFNLNSPTTNVTHSNSNYTIIGSPTNNEHPLKTCSKPLISQGEKPRALGVFVPKSFTVNSLKDVDSVNFDRNENESCKMDLTCSKENALSKVVLRRPNMLDMNSNNKALGDEAKKQQIPTMTSSKSVNTLKRPSSILLGFSNTASSSNVFSNSPLKSPQSQQNESHQHQDHHQQSSFTQQHQPSLLLGDKKFGLLANTLPSPALASFQFSTSSVNSSSTVTPLTRTLSNTSASSSSSSCSCCSNVSSSSNSVSSFNQPSPYVCNSCASQQFNNTIGFKHHQQQQHSQLQQEQQYQCQKKMKLSPIQDKFNFLSSFGIMVRKILFSQKSILSLVYF